MKAIFALLAFTNAAWADCLDGEGTFLSCRIADSENVLRVCFTATDTFYRFGPLGQTPDLELMEPIASVDYQPWNGVGRSISEAITFNTGPYSYLTYAGFERMFGEEEYEDIPHRSFGGVTVTKNDTEIARLECDRSSVDFGWDVALFEAKQALGFVWDDRNREWVELPD
ncbi:hypothetical protein L0664_02965 [Octadecabacter sp. G9-8]|uniref:Uncharacterized protein n=1 Tax=Octadecabacter dasysiphoniae TaxID=2909341 RepID=A0ABS9CVG9_9RHOB|nr:hypothetical protein [Octadecabacter dasysiphoniae]MCF2870018.1 hypothetical protein [Octadecabacter dasysiphoniae]